MVPLQLLINIAFSFQRYQIQKILQEKQIHLLHHDPMTDSLKVNHPKIYKISYSAIANNDQHKVLFLMVHNTIGFARETNSPFKLWSRDAFFEGQ